MVRPTIKVKVELTDEDLKWPEYKTEWSAAADIRCPVRVELTEASPVAFFALALKTNIPKGYVAIVVPRSSTGNAGLALANTVGIIDADYPGVWHSKIFKQYWADDIVIEKDEGFLQVMFVKAERAKFFPGTVEQVTDRTSGHGHTGRF